MFWIAGIAVYVGLGHVFYLLTGADKKLDDVIAEEGPKLGIVPGLKTFVRVVSRIIWLIVWPGPTASKAYKWLRRRVSHGNSAPAGADEVAEVGDGK
jgi:hypothetical protein